MGRREGRLAGHQVSGDQLTTLLVDHQTWWDPTRGVSGCACGHIYAGMVDGIAEKRHYAEVILADGWAKVTDEAPEVRYAELVDGATELDEVVARNAYVHLEAMSDSAWWLGIEAGGQMVHVNLWTKRAKITGRAEVDDL